MNKNEMLVALAQIGLKCQIRRTGHPDYERGFVLNACGISMGRITIFKGQYDHIKWYLSAQGNITEHHDYDFDRYSWAVLLKTGEVMTREQWNEYVAKARVLAQAEVDRKKAFRKANPKVDKNGKPKSRVALALPNGRGQLNRLLGTDEY